MNPLRIRAERYRSFAELDLHLPEGLCALVGANGAGKSSIVNAIELALFGPSARNLGDFLSDDTVGVLMVELEFEHRGQTYRVRRSYSPTGRGSSKLDFEAYDFEGDDAVYLSLTRETAAATQQLIEQTIGLSRATFRASAFLAQGDGAAFTEASPRDRKSILAECVGLHIWDRLLARVKRDRAVAEHDVSTATLVIEQAGHELAYRADTVTERDVADHQRVDLAARLSDDLASVAVWEDRVAVARDAHTKRAATEANALSAKAALTRVQGEIIRHVEERSGLEEALAGRGQLELDADLVDPLEREHGTLTAAVNTHTAAERERAQARAELERLTIERTRLFDEAATLDDNARQDRAARDDMTAAPVATCQTCGQNVEGEARQRAATALTDAAEQAEKRAVTLRGQAADLEALIAEQRAVADRELAAVDPERHATVLARLRAARAATVQLAALDVKQQQLAHVDQELARLRAERPALEQAVADAEAELEKLGDAQPVAAVQASLDEAKHTADERRMEVSRLEQRIAALDERLERYAQLDRQITEARENQARAQTELDLCLLLERAYGRDGIPALIVENAAIPQIEAEANRILDQLGTPYRVELQTQRALKSGDGLRDTLDIVVHAGGASRPYETFSGGERTRLNLALRIALARLLAHRRGAEVRMLAIDEPEFLDDAGVAALVTVLRALTADFDRILLVSHVPSLRDALEQSLVVVKDGDRSRVVGADREPVMAA